MWCVHNIHVDVCFEIENGETSIQPNTKPAARKTQIVRQEEKKTYTHDTESSKTGKQRRNMREGDQYYFWYSAKAGDSHSTVLTQRLGRYR